MLWLNPSDTYVDLFPRESNDQSTQWMSETGVIDLFFLPGVSPRELLDSYTQLTSRAQFPPFFALGYHQSRWNYLDERDVLGVSSKFESLDFPLDVVWLDIEHTAGKKYFTWDRNNFPNSEKMVGQLASHGHKLVTIVDPHVKKETGYAIYDQLRQLDYFLRTPAGEVFEGWCWPGTSSYPDFTDGRVREWWGNQFAYANYAGTSRFVYTWNDMNEVGQIQGVHCSPPCSTDRKSHYPAISSISAGRNTAPGTICISS